MYAILAIPVAAPWQLNVYRSGDEDEDAVAPADADLLAHVDPAIRFMRALGGGVFVAAVPELV